MSNPENIILPALIDFYKAGHEYHMPERDGSLRNDLGDKFNRFVTELANECGMNQNDYLYGTENYKNAIDKIYSGALKQPIACNFSYYLIFGRCHIKLELIGRYSLARHDEQIISVFSDMLKLAVISDIEKFVKYVREQVSSNIFFKMNYTDDSQKFRDLCTTLKDINNQKQEIA